MIKCSWRKQINTLLTEIYKTFSGENPYLYEKTGKKSLAHAQSAGFRTGNISHNKLFIIYLLC